jgi:hypothetical protein
MAAMDPYMWKILGPLAVMCFILALYLGDSILAFAAEQLRERRTNRLAVERERTKQASLARDRDAMVWHQLGSVTDTNDQVSRRS